MTAYTATFSNGETFKRTSARTYSHAIMITDSRVPGNKPRCYWAGSLALAQRKGPQEARHGFDAFEIVAAITV